MRNALSDAQNRFMDRLANYGGRHQSPHTNGRETVTALSAWHRTAESLQRRGLITLVSNGSITTAYFRQDRITEKRS